MKKTEIREILNFMNSLYPNRKININTETVNTWFDMLEDYTIEDVKKSIKSLALKCRYIPNIAEIIGNMSTSFDVRKIQKDGVVHLWIRFQSEQETFPFTFQDEVKCQEFIKHLQSNPAIEDIRELHQQMLIGKNSHESFFYRERFNKIMTDAEFEKAKLNEWRSKQ